MRRSRSSRRGRRLRRPRCPCPRTRAGTPGRWAWAATAISIVLGIGLIAYSVFTNYELGVWKVAPMAVHNLIDVVAGALLAASPWLFGFVDDGAQFWVPFVVIGVAAIFLGLTTKQKGG